MRDISPESTNEKPSAVRRMPEPSSLSSGRMSESHFGCVRSPVPSRVSPFILPYFSRFCRVRSFEVAWE